MAVLGLKDEYCHQNLKHKFVHMGKVEIIENANHAITGEKEQQEFIVIVEDFMR